MNGWIQISVGVAAVVAVMTGIFRATNDWIVTKVGVEVQGRLDLMKADLLESLASREGLTSVVAHQAETNTRFDREFEKVWAEISKFIQSSNRRGDR